MAFGAPTGRALLALTAAWHLLALSNTVSGAAAAFPEGGAERLAPLALAATLFLLGLGASPAPDAESRGQKPPHFDWACSILLVAFLLLRM